LCTTTTNVILLDKTTGFTNQSFQIIHTLQKFTLPGLKQSNTLLAPAKESITNGGTKLKEKKKKEKEKKQKEKEKQSCHPEHLGRLLAARPIAADPEDKPSHFGDVMLTGKLFSSMFIFKLEMEIYLNRTEYATNGPQLHRKQCLTVSICHVVKIDLKTESN
jgi:hypothetical protein